jgi:hypothetical protein
VLNYFLIVLVAIIVVPLLIGAVATSGRYVIRERARKRRAALIGEFIWNEIEYEGNFRKFEGPNDQIHTSDLVGLVTLAESVRSSFPHRDRGIISYVWSRHEDTSIHLYLGISSEHYGDGSQVRIAAQSVGARANRMDSQPFIPVEDISVAYRAKSSPLQATSPVKEGGSVAKALSTVLERLPKEVAASFVVTTEFMTDGEKRQLAGFITADNIASGGDSMQYGMGVQTQTMSNQPIRATIVASTSMPAQGKRSMSTTLLSSAVNSIATSGWQHSVKPFSAASVGKTGGVLSSVAAIISLLFTVVQGIPWFLGVPLILLSVGIGWFSLFKANTMSIEAVRERLTMGEFNVPPYVFWLWNPRWFFESRTLGMRYGGNSVESHEASPSTKRVNYLSPIALFEILSFPSAFSRGGGDIHAGASLSRGIPNSMIDTKFPIYYGQSGSGQWVSLDITDLHYSMYTAGAPNSGKTNFLQVIFAGTVKACLERTNNLQITPIWAETKGEGAADAWEIARKHKRAIFIEAHNPRSQYRLSLEGRRLSEGASVDEVRANIDVLVSGMQFAYGDGIRAASREVLYNSLLIAMTMNESDFEFLGMENYVNIVKPNIVETARILLGGESTIDVGERILQLQNEMVAKGTKDPREQVLGAAIGKLSRFFDPTLRRSSQSGSVLGPALNKIAQMAEANVLWSPDERPAVAVSQFPFHFAPIVLNMGPFRLPSGSYDSTVGSSAARKLLLITNYILWNTIKARCSGWQAQGKRIPMFFDEVADVAVDSDNDDVANVISEAGKEGRSRGASYFLGSQSPSQMPFQAKATVLSSRTKFWFNLHESNDLRTAISEISSASEEQNIYSTNDIHSLPNGTAVGVMQRGDRPTPPFTLRVPLATKWAEFLLRQNTTVGDAIVEYYEWQERERRAKLTDGKIAE